MIRLHREEDIKAGDVLFTITIHSRRENIFVFYPVKEMSEEGNMTYKKILLSIMYVYRVDNKWGKLLV